jgi:hypothetical protein
VGDGGEVSVWHDRSQGWREGAGEGVVVQEAHNALDLCWVGAKGQVDVTGADGHGVAVNLRGGGG